MAEEDAAPQMVEVLTVLKKLGDHLTVEEITFLQANSGINLLAFEDASSSLGGVSVSQSVCVCVSLSICHHQMLLLCR